MGAEGETKRKRTLSSSLFSSFSPLLPLSSAPLLSFPLAPSAFQGEGQDGGESRGRDQPQRPLPTGDFVFN